MASSLLGPEMAGLNPQDGGSKFQDAINAFLGSELPVDFSVDNMATFVAEHLALNQKSDVAQTGVYILSKVTILQLGEVLGIGAGFTSLDLSGLTLAKILLIVQDIQQKTNILLDSPLKLALKFYKNAIIQFQNGETEQSIEEIKIMRAHAMQAVVFSTSKKANKENLKDAAVAVTLSVVATVMLTSFDAIGQVILPFYMLSQKKKNVIVSMLENDLSELTQFSDKIEKSSWLPLSAKNKNEHQDLVDNVLKICYPFLSEGKGMTSSLTTPNFRNLKVLPKYLPEGEEDATEVTIGRKDGKPKVYKLWREKSKENVSVCIAPKMNLWFEIINNTFFWLPVLVKNKDILSEHP